MALLCSRAVTDSWFLLWERRHRLDQSAYSGTDRPIASPAFRQLSSPCCSGPHTSGLLALVCPEFGWGQLRGLSPLGLWELGDRLRFPSACGKTGLRFSKAAVGGWRKGGSTGRKPATLSAGLPQPPAGAAVSIALLESHANQGRRCPMSRRAQHTLDPRRFDSVAVPWWV